MDQNKWNKKELVKIEIIMKINLPFSLFLTFPFFYSPAFFLTTFERIKYWLTHLFYIE
jgi:hypothetical protein